MTKNVVGIEIGSSKIRGAIGVYNDDGVLTVTAVEEEPLVNWVRYGMVSNVEEVAALVSRIIRKIENRVSPRKITSVYVSMGGRSLRSRQRDVERHFTDEVEITDAILAQLDSDLTKSPVTDSDMLAVVPREYVIDKHTAIHPKGIVGKNIRMSANIIVCRPQTKRNIDRLFGEKLKLDVAGYEVRQLALADTILTHDEKQLGVMLVDFGAETTTVSIYKHGNLQYLATLPLGSRNITRDITSLNYLEDKAETLKCTVGSMKDTPNAYDTQVEGVDYTMLNNFVFHRGMEIIQNIREQVKIAGFLTSQLPAGIVVVGGGTRLVGFNEALREKSAMKLRVGTIINPKIHIADSRVSPADYADVISMLYSAASRGSVECLMTPQPQVVVEPTPEPKKPEPIVEIVREQPKPTPEPKPEKEEKPKKEKSGPSFLDRWKSKIEKIMTEPDEYDPDFRDD